jgi:RNA polymerase sigma-70 factor (ECF subfamily)
MTDQFGSTAAVQAVSAELPLVVRDPAADLARADHAVREVDERHGQVLLGLALRSGLARDAAEDAVQEALLRLWIQIRGGLDILEPRAWCLRTLYRIAMDEHRVRRRAADLVARLSNRPLHGLDPDAAQRLSIWQLVDRLPTRQRQVLYLRYKADLPFEQVGAVMGITASAARAHATFAAKRLHAAMGATWET